MLTGPDEVERRRERIWAVPFNGGSMEDRSEFLHANPMPRDLSSFGSFHRQKNV